METEDLKYKIVLDAGEETEVVAYRGGGLASLDIATAFMATITRYRGRNVQLCEGARITTQNMKPARVGASRAFRPA